MATPTPPSSVSPAGGCREKEFRCENGRCVAAGPLGVVCDGVNDCGDGSDEKHCGELTHLLISSSGGTKKPACDIISRNVQSSVLSPYAGHRLD